MPLTPGRTYVNGTRRLWANMTNEDDLDVDPSGSITFYLMSPRGEVTSYVYDVDAEIVKESTGDYWIDIQFTEPGRWYYKWQTTGLTTAQVEEGSVLVSASPFYDLDRSTGYS